MQDTELYLELAGIAGVFVGFGALIAVRSGGASGPEEVSPVRVTVAMGVLVIIGALVPVTLGRYGLTNHEVLALSSVLVLVGAFGTMLVYVRTPEYKALAATRGDWWGGRPSDVIQNLAWLALVGTVALAPIAIVLGAVPDLEAALYFTVLVLVLLLAAWALMYLVFAQRRPGAREPLRRRPRSAPDQPTGLAAEVDVSQANRAALPPLEPPPRILTAS